MDTKCNARDATVATVTALSTGVPKHIIFGGLTAAEVGADGTKQIYAMLQAELHGR